jgi:hypothetical protein
VSNTNKTAANPKRITRAHLATQLYVNGCGPSNKPITDIAFAMVKAGLDEYLALQFARLAHYAKEGYTWKFDPAEGNPLWPIHYYIQRKNAAANPRCKDAEDLAAALEKRPSRWGSAEFHHTAGEEDGKGNVTEHYPFRTPSEERTAPAGPRDGLPSEVRS